MSSRRRRANATPAARRRSGGDADFWGRDPSEPVAPERIRPSEDPTALVRSLGPPPLPGVDQRVAEGYFAAVYEKSANLAVALAAASGLLDTSDEEDDGGDPGRT